MEGLGVGCSTDSLRTRKFELKKKIKGKDTILKCII